MNKKNTVQTKSFPTMPKASDSQIVSALASNTQRADVIVSRGKSYDFKDTDVPAVNTNHYNRNAGLNKSKVIELVSSSNDPSNTFDPVSHFPQDYNSWTSEQKKNADPVGTYYIGSGDKAVKGNVYAKDVTAPVTFDDKDDKYIPSNLGSANNNLDILDVCAMFDYMDYNTNDTPRWSKNSTDCSSFVVRVYSSLGKNLAEDDGPYTTAAGMAKSLDDKGQRINKEDLQPGDLIFWSLKDAPDRYYGITHVAIFAGYDENGVPMMWEAASCGVQYVPVSKQGEPLQYARAA